ncbi:hypothetical protein IC757_11525 [Wenzhouxiangella sp. AB-CW3]|uniref:hypothetical protein n=1 Tax=Wenzhouxiangella sp. AB-CW3 TaxID=2771012 RepID=UPI00168ADA5A|nr:hypothetical protein [Wenzhouxiangella sp. AB-CW3]QOC21668.1 hypothetical protein IC757_11525 [Wenzhouxiangella sp. AB-CW3]
MMGQDFGRAGKCWQWPPKLAVKVSGALEKSTMMVLVIAPMSGRFKGTLPTPP